MAGRKDKARVQPQGRGRRTVGQKPAPASPVRKKPCPLCGKRLQAKSKGQWRSNLARHAANCREYQREAMLMSIRVVGDIARFFLGVEPSLVGPFPKTNAKAEVEELERLHTLEVPKEPAQ